MTSRCGHSLQKVAAAAREASDSSAKTFAGELKPSAIHSREGPSKLLFTAFQSLQAAVKGKALGCALPRPGVKGPV